MSRQAVTAPEPFVRLVTRVVGGPDGRHLRTTTNRWWNPLVVSTILGTLLWLGAWLRWLPCRQKTWDKAPDVYANQCYTDIVPLYASRGLADGNRPYFDVGQWQVLEYPVGTGYLMDLARRLTALFGAPVGPGLDSQQLVEAQNMFMAVNAVLLFGLFLVAIWAFVRGSIGREWDVMAFAASPAVFLTGLINWDMLPVALTAIGVMLWARRRPGWAGAALGLAMAAKLYAGFLLGPLLLLCLRSGKVREFARAFGAFVLAWLAANLPVMIGAPAQWKVFWTFNSDREGDFGSIWYLGVLNGTPMPSLNFWSTLTFAIGCALVAAIILLAPQRPRLGQVGFLVLTAFLLTNKVYSPQYVLWALPFLAMARPKWRTYLVWLGGEWIYNIAIWGHLGQYLNSGSGGHGLFWLATLLRLGTEAYAAIVVARAALDPAHDLVRQDAAGRAYADDPSGGVLDGAPDAPAFVRWRTRAMAVLTGTARIVPQTERDALAWLGGVWIVSRLALMGTAISYMATTDKRVTYASIFSNWDVSHFIAIAEKGYLDDDKRMAFFPGLPMVLKAFHTVGLPTVVGGMIVSLIATALAAWALYRLGGFWAAALWLVAPTMVFTFVPYTEALFCAFAFWAWWFAKQDRWLWAGLLAGGASSVRVSGLFLTFALGIMVLTWDRRDVELGTRVANWFRRGVWLLIPVAVMGAYMTYLHALTGSWNAWNEAQKKGWQRSWTLPWESVMNTIPVIVPGGYADHPGWAIIFRFEVLSMMVGLVATGWLLARRMWAEAAWIFVQVFAFSTSYWLFSVNRAVLLWFPVWIVAAELIAWRPRSDGRMAAKSLAVAGWVITSVWVGLWWAQMFYDGQWAS